MTEIKILSGDERITFSLSLRAFRIVYALRRIRRFLKVGSIWGEFVRETKISKIDGWKKLN